MTATNATITGDITATSGSFNGTLSASVGSIGGFTIGSSSLIAGDASTRVSVATSGIHLGNNTFGSAPFRVTTAGALTATNATITGDITATSGNFAGSLSASSGNIGGWTIDSSTLFTGTKDISGYTTTGISLNGSGNGSLHSQNFYIDTSGNAKFKGDLEAATGTFGGSLTAKSISAGNIVADTITSTEIAADSITAEELEISASSGDASSDRIFFDGANNRIDIYAGGNLRVRIGKLTT